MKLTTAVMARAWRTERSAELRYTGRSGQPRLMTTKASMVETKVPKSVLSRRPGLDVMQSGALASLELL